MEPIAASNAHGALVTGLTSQDVTLFDRLFARPLVDSAATEPELAFDDVAFPARLQTVTTYETATGRKQRLVLAQGQFFAAAPDDGLQSGVQRLFTHIEGYVFTSTSSDYEPPFFRNVQAVKVGGAVTFTTELGSADAVERVLVLFLDGAGAWTPLDLVPVAGGRWSGSAAVSAATVQYVVQAADANGNVAVSTNKGFYYAGEAAPPPTPGGVEPTLTGPQTAGTYTGRCRWGPPPRQA